MSETGEIIEAHHFLCSCGKCFLHSHLKTMMPAAFMRPITAFGDAGHAYGT